jgi:hypothetical protein
MSLAYDYINQSVLTSLHIAPKDDDAFFNPQRLTHNGFAWDGYKYVNGVKDLSTRPSWATEGGSDTRGILETFPTDAVVLVSAASVAILDATTTSLRLWMLFYTVDSYAIPVNPIAGQTVDGGIASFTPKSANWANGVLSIVMEADPGSTAMPVAVITIDFTTDTVFAEYSLPA